MKKMIKACIFDLDGTLLDTLSSIEYYLNRTLKSHGFCEITREECKSFIGDGARLLVARALAAQGVTDAGLVDCVLSDYSESYDKAPYYLTKPYPDIIELIDALRNKGIKLGVLSNKPDSTTVSVVKEFFGSRFDFVRGGLAGVKLKPEPDACLEMLEKMGTHPSSLAFIGDTAVDIETARRTGAALKVGVSWGFREREELVASGADKIADTALDILKLVGAE